MDYFSNTKGYVQHIYSYFYIIIHTGLPPPHLVWWMNVTRQTDEQFRRASKKKKVHMELAYSWSLESKILQRMSKISGFTIFTLHSAKRGDRLFKHRIP